MTEREEIDVHGIGCNLWLVARAVYCGAEPTRLYPCGQRCAEHAPKREPGYRGGS